MTLRKPHHHGDLREALIRAGLELLTESGAQGLTLRRAAARAGVTHAAPAHHFDGLDGLRNAIAERGYENLFKNLKITENNKFSDDYEQLLSLTKVYLKFASDNEALFHLMSTQVKTGSDSLRIAAGKCYGILQISCSRLNHDHDPVAFEFAVWTLTHGYATLDVANRRPKSGAVTPPSFDVMFQILVPRSTLT